MKNVISFLGEKIREATDSITDILTDHRSILCWVYSIFYLFLVCYCVRSHPETMNTAIMVTGGVVSTIFASYVAGSAYENVKMPLPVTDPQAESDSAGD